VRGAFVVTPRKADHDEHCTHDAAGPHHVRLGAKLVDHGRREIYSLETYYTLKGDSNGFQ